MEVDEILRDFLNSQFRAISEKIDTVVAPIMEDIKNHKSDINDLYDKDRETKERLKEVEVSFKSHEKMHEDSLGKKRFGYEMWIVVIVFLADKVFQYIK